MRRPVRLGPRPPQVLRRPQPDQEDTRTEPELLQVNRKSREWSKHVENKRVLQGSTGSGPVHRRVSVSRRGTSSSWSLCQGTPGSGVGS